MNQNLPHPLGVRGPSPRGKFELFQATRPPQHLPSFVSYKYEMPAVYDQGEMSDCVANSVNAVVSFFLRKRRDQMDDLSRAATYSQSKLLYEGADFSMPGEYPASALELFRDKGAVLESQWPSTDANVQATTPIAADLWNPTFKINGFVEVNNDWESIMQALHEAGPVIFALDWPNSWFTPNADGTLPAPDFSAGGHCTVLDEGDLINRRFDLRNSWGRDWGVKGYAKLGFDQVAAQAMNCYTVQLQH